MMKNMHICMCVAMKKEWEIENARGVDLVGTLKILEILMLKITVERNNVYMKKIDQQALSNN